MTCFVRSGANKAWFPMDLCAVYPTPFLPKSPTTATPTLYHETPRSASILISPFSVASDGFSFFLLAAFSPIPTASARHSKCCGWFGGTCTQVAHVVIARETE